MSTHYTRDYVWVVFTDLASFGSIPYQKLRDLGVTGIYLAAQDNLATDAKRKEVVGAGFKCGLFYPASSSHQFGDDVAQLASARLTSFAKTEDGGQTPVLLDMEPSDGSTQFWLDFLWGNLSRQSKGWRGSFGVQNGGGFRPGRVSDMTPEPFKATVMPFLDLEDAHLDVKVQGYFGDMSPVDAGEAARDWERVGYDREAIRGFVDGGRKSPPPIMYQGRVVRRLENGTCIWNANLLREAQLI